VGDAIDYVHGRLAEKVSECFAEARSLKFEVVRGTGH